MFWKERARASRLKGRYRAIRVRKIFVRPRRNVSIIGAREYSVMAF